MIVVFGSITMDMVMSLPDLPRVGQTLMTDDAMLQPGGKGANQAVAARRDGARVILAGAGGQDPRGAARAAAPRWGGWARRGSTCAGSPGTRPARAGSRS